MLQHPGANALLIAMGFIGLALVLGWLVRPDNEDDADGHRNGRDAVAAEDRDRDGGDDGRAGDATSRHQPELAGRAEDADDPGGRTAVARGFIATFGPDVEVERWPGGGDTGESAPSTSGSTDGSGSGSGSGSRRASPRGTDQPAGGSGSTDTTPPYPSTEPPPVTSPSTTGPPTTQPPTTEPTEPNDPALLDVVGGLLDVVGGLL